MANKYEKTFIVKATGESTGEQFIGSFTVKTRLSHRDHLNRDALRRQLLGERQDQASERAVTSAEIFSQLATRIVEAPSWWTGSENGLGLFDDNVPIEVYQEAVKAEADAIDEVKKKAEAAKADLETVSKE